MHADCFFRIGKTHKVCEDYARAGFLNDDPDRPFGAISDGCSGSPDTDFGSRFLVLAAEECMARSGNPTESEILYKAIELGHHPLLNPLNLDATLMTLHRSATTANPHVAVSGDGVVSARTPEGDIHTFVIEFLPGVTGKVAPFYLSYSGRMDQRRLDHFVAQGYNRRKISFFLNGELQDEEVEEVPPDLSWDQSRARNWTKETVPGAFDLIAIFSDGVQSFRKEVRPKFFEAVSVHDVLEQVMAIKVAKGEFVTRRCQKFFSRFCVKNDWHHDDDFSIAAIWCGD